MSYYERRGWRWGCGLLGVLANDSDADWDEDFRNLSEADKNIVMIVMRRLNDPDGLREGGGSGSE
jgi:hypothetical protein